MDIQTEKIELAKRLLDTEDKNIIDAIKSVFKSFDSEEDWGDLPDKVIADAKESITQIETGKGIDHNTARKTYQKWL
jgi:hypothetical protein